MTKKQTNRKTKISTEESSELNLPTYFLSLLIENVRCFGPRQELELSDRKGRPARWTIILGDNGVGKTTLLQSLVSIVPVPSPIALNSSPVNGTEASYRLSAKILRSDGPVLRDDQTEKRSFIVGKFINRAKLSSVGKNEKVIELMLFGRGGGSYLASTVTYADVACFAYGAARRMGSSSLSDTKESDPTASLFSENTELLNAEEWLLQADYAASKTSAVQKKMARRRDQIKELLISLLPDVSDIRFTQLSENEFRPSIEVKTPYGWVSIKELSLGYKTLIAWMVDLASRLFERYPNSSDPLAEPAIVLVDEIDLHLHPKWQRSLMSFLTERFVNTQFIATAHSPLVVQAATDANIVVLRREGDHVVIDNDVEAIQGWRIDQVLTSDLFGLESARPPNIDHLLEERRKILSKGRISQKDKKRLEKLEAKIGPLPAGETPEDIEAMAIIHRAANRLKKERIPSSHDSDQ